MKSFLSIALLGALAFAGTPEEDDAAAKKAVVSTRNEGATVGTYTHMISGTAWAMKDATNDAGTITVSTSWNRTGGTDSQDIFGLHMKFAPSATYTPGTAQLEYVMAKDAFTKPMQLVRFSSAIGTLTLHTYNWADIPMSVPEFVTAKGLLSAASQTAIGANSFKFYYDANNKFTAQDKMNDATTWQVNADSTYDAKTGGMHMSLSRNNAGPAELKIGGAIYGAASYKDAKLAKMTSAGGYIKFADDAKPATTTTTTTVKQGAAALTTYGALALATAYALF